MKIILRVVAVLLLVFGLVALTYAVGSRITRYESDKSVVIAPPGSPKSVEERYAFGYDPAPAYTEERADCAERFATRKAMFGDLHIHTAISADAFPDGTRTFPDAVYRFAKGEKIALPTTEGAEPATSQLARPLDFAGVTDHAETFGEGYICRTKGAFPGYDSESCQKFRAGGEEGVRVFMTQNAKVRPGRDESVCGKDYADCEAADKIVWNQMIAWAEEAYDRSPACSFTSFIGYEYTRSPNSMHMHRNTIFRNGEVPERPATFLSHPSNYALLTSLEQDCRAGLERCDVLSIPHNSNISGGNAFNLQYVNGFSEESQAAFWRLRRSFDRLVELTQHKGTSECLNGASDILGDIDELCEVEQLRQFGQPEQAGELNTWFPRLINSESAECSEDDLDPKDNLYKGFCLSSRDFARGALLYGMEHGARTGVNPFEFGFIGSSDTHISNAGNTAEATWPGYIAYETSLAGRLGQAAIGRFNRLVSNPGGLAGVYAVENSRDAIFHSMKRREAFATSGTRIEPRLFAGLYPKDLCSRGNWLSEAYRLGTPMGSRLDAQGQPFQLLVQAKRDPESNPLARLQLVKGWIDTDGRKRFEVIDLQRSEGADELCAVYTDPTYDPALPTYYYMRAVETASPRWSKAQCDALPAGRRPALCDNDQPESTYEMAWASPIWFTPSNRAPAAAMAGPGSPHPHRY